MGEKIKICEKCIDLHITENDCKSVLNYLTGLMVRQGYVDEIYAEKIYEREQKYPTGLQFENIAIALPHGDADYVKESGIAVGKCNQKPVFRSMEDAETEISVDLVVLLAVKNPETHLTVLNNLMEMFSEQEKCEKILSADEKEICEILGESLYLE